MSGFRAGDHVVHCEDVGLGIGVVKVASSNRERALVKWPSIADLSDEVQVDLRQAEHLRRQKLALVRKMKAQLILDINTDVGRETSQAIRDAAGYTELEDKEDK